MMGGVSSLYSFLNIVILSLQCCESLSDKGLCVHIALPVVQLLIQWIMFSITCILFFVYFPGSLKHKLPTDQDHDKETTGPQITPEKTQYWKDSLKCAKILIINLMLSFTITIGLLLHREEDWAISGSVIWAKLIGYSSMVLTILQFLPQIRTTFQRKSCGALSIPMLCVHAPGNYF